MARPLTLEVYDNVLKLGEQLRQAFPKCFFPMGHEKPLKIGIFHDLLGKLNEFLPKPDKKVIRAFMMIYTNSVSYRASLIMPNAVRIDLDGNECDRVTNKERYKAKITTRKITWALETEGYEAEQVKTKAKLIEQSKVVTLVRIPKKSIEESKESINRGRNFNQIILPAAGKNKKSITIIVKKKRDIFPKDYHLHE